MKKFLVILLLLSANFTFAQQLTFADILKAEPEVKQSSPKKSTEKVTKYKAYSPSHLETLDRIFFESYLSMLGSVGSLSSSATYDAHQISFGMGVEYEFGARLTPLFFVGAGVGARTYLPESGNSYGYVSNWGFNMPLYAVAKLYMLSNYDFSLSADFNMGGCINIQESFTTPYGWFLRVGLGADFKRFTLAAGYELIASISSGSLGNYGYLKLGVIISK